MLLGVAEIKLDLEFQAVKLVAEVLEARKNILSYPESPESKKISLNMLEDFISLF